MKKNLNNISKLTICNKKNKKSKECKRIICKQKPNQYIFTLPKCKSGKTVGGYCVSKMKKKNTKKVKSCKHVHLTK